CARVIRGVTVAEDGRPFTVAVSRGATLRGTIRPASAVEALRGSRYARRTARLRGAHDVGAPGLVLEREHEGEGTERWPPGARTIILAADGSFTAYGVPPGTWRLWLEYEPATSLNPTWSRAPTGSASRKFVRDQFVLVNVLRDVEVRALQLDVIRRLPARIEGRVFVDGEPWRNQKVYFWREGGDIFLGSNAST